MRSSFALRAISANCGNFFASSPAPYNLLFHDNFMLWLASRNVMMNANLAHILQIQSILHPSLLGFINELIAMSLNTYE